MKTKGRRIDTLEKGKEKGWGIHDEVEYKGQPNQDKAPKKKKRLSPKFNQFRFIIIHHDASPAVPFVKGAAPAAATLSLLLFWSSKLPTPSDTAELSTTPFFTSLLLKSTAEEETAASSSALASVFFAFVTAESEAFVPSMLVDSSSAADDPGIPMDNPLFFLTFFLFGSDAPDLAPNNEPGAVGGACRFDGLEVGPPRPEGGGILPDAGRRGRAAMGRCFGGNSRSSTKGSLLLFSSLLLKNSCTSPICDDRDSFVIRGYCGGVGKMFTACVGLEEKISDSPWYLAM